MEWFIEYRHCSTFMVSVSTLTGRRIYLLKIKCNTAQFGNKIVKINNIKEGRNVLLNVALNTFYLRLYGVGYRTKNNSNSERGNPLSPLCGLLFPISSKGSFTHTIKKEKSKQTINQGTSRRDGTRNN